MLGDEVGVKFDKDKGVTVPPELKSAIQKFYANGWFGLGYSEDIGGMPMPQSISSACASIFTGANVALSMYSSLSMGCMNVILKVGSQEQKDFYVPMMMQGKWGGTMCLTESGAGSDVGAVKTTAVIKDDGSYSINGVKIFISSGDSDIYENNIHLVLARTPGASEGTKGLSLFVVPKFKSNADGSLGDFNHAKCTKIEEKMGIHASATSEITFGAEGESIGYLIGNELDGMANMFIMMNEARLSCGIQGEAQANLAYELTKQYTKERSQFGKEIEHHPDVKRMLLKMRAMSRGMRSLILYSSNLFDCEERGVEGAEEELALLIPICKSFCTDEGFNVSVDAIQVHGGYGFCTEYGIEQFARDTKIATIYEGTNGIQSIDFVMRKILGDQGKVFGEFITKIQASMASAGNSGWDDEIKSMASSLMKGQQILELYGEFAKKKEIHNILSSTMDFLNYCGNIIITWRLLDAANIAKKALDAGATGDDKFYYESKIVDFKVYCQHYLTRNVGIAHSILNFNQDLTSLEL
jgi:alkylation response protein AidB-like acyl-CoA dehydrogenase